MSLMQRIKSRLSGPENKPVPGRVSYSQSGEDILLDQLLRAVLELKEIAYLDIGTNDPIKLNNTYLFYEAGFHGVCVEPDPSLCGNLQLVRPRDVCLNAGAGLGSVAAAPFYVFEENTMNTFSREESERYKTMGYKLARMLDIPLMPVNEIIEKHLPRGVNLLSIDAEGLDFEILKSVDFSRFRPEAVCIETASHSTKKKRPEIFEFMQSIKYLVFADTYINTIFVEQSVWDAKVKPVA